MWLDAQEVMRYRCTLTCTEHSHVYTRKQKNLNRYVMYKYELQNGLKSIKV